MKSKKISTKNMILCAVFTALIAVGAFIKIPVPGVPFTLQFQFVMLAGLLLGGKLGGISVFTYIALGLLGLPVFTGGGGIFYIFKPTFGYIIGFFIAACVTGYISNKNDNPSYKRLFVAVFSGLVIVYFLGFIYYWIISKFYLGNSIGLMPLFVSCVLLVIPGDIVLSIASIFAAKRLIPIIHKKF